MIAAGFFQANNELKRLMTKEFKELGYDLTGKKKVIKAVLGREEKLNNLTISEMERVVKYLNNESDKETLEREE